MAITKDDLREFHRFADEKLEHGGADSIVELAGEWESQRRETQSPAPNGVSNPIGIDDDTLRALAAAFPDVQDEASCGKPMGGVAGVRLLKC